MGNTPSTTGPSAKALAAQLQQTPPTNTSAIELLLSRGADPNCGAPTPLVAAVISGCMPTIRLLVAHGAHTNRLGGGKLKFSNYHGTPLMAAASEGNFEAAIFLLAHGADVNGPSLTIPPLVAAIHAKNLGMMEFLLDRGADPNRSTFGARPVRFAFGQSACSHNVRKPPKATCQKCQCRLFSLRMMAVLTRYGGRPIVAMCHGGSGDELLDAYVDMIAHYEKWEERGERVGKWLADATFNDPTIKAMSGMLIGAGLGAVGIQTPVQSVGGMLAADAGGQWPEFEPKSQRVEKERKRKPVEWDPRTG